MAQSDEPSRPPRIPPTILAAIGILIAGYLYRRSNGRRNETVNVAPGPPRWASLRLLLPGGPDQLTVFRRLQQKYGDVVRFSIAGRTVHIVSSAQGAKYVLQDNNANYLKGRGLEKARDILGEGLLTSEGEHWRRQRRLIQPVFHRQRIASFATTMASSTEAMLARWIANVNKGEAIDIADEMMRLTLDIVSKTLFSTALKDSEFDTVARVMRPMLHYATRRIMSPFDFLEQWPTPENIRQQRRQEMLNEIVYRIIEDRRRSGAEHDDLLGLLMVAEDEASGRRMDDRQLRDEVITIFLAGHETTANLLSFLWALLSQHTEVRRQVQEEIDRVLEGRAPAADDVPHLHLTNMLILETLRLYPPAWIIGRQSIDEDRIGGYMIPAKSGVLISPYIMHRHPDYWQNPEDFDPWRFSEDRSKDRPRYAFIPFGGGPRLCIGNNFALTEAAIVVALIAQRYELNLVANRPVEAEAAFTLRPKDGVWMTLHARR